MGRILERVRIRTVPYPSPAKPIPRYLYLLIESSLPDNQIRVRIFAYGEAGGYAMTWLQAIRYCFPTKENKTEHKQRKQLTYILAHDKHLYQIKTSARSLQMMKDAIARDNQEQQQREKTLAWKIDVITTRMKYGMIRYFRRHWDVDIDKLTTQDKLKMLHDAGYHTVNPSASN